MLYSSALFPPSPGYRRVVSVAASALAAFLVIHGFLYLLSCTARGDTSALGLLPIEVSRFIHNFHEAQANHGSYETKKLLSTLSTAASFRRKCFPARDLAEKKICLNFSYINVEDSYLKEGRSPSSNYHMRLYILNIW